MVPSLVTVRAVGPGGVPAGTSVDVLLDARVVQDVEARTTEDAVLTRGRRAGDVVRLRWRLGEPLAAGARRSARLVVRTAEPRGGLDGFQAPTVSVVPPYLVAGQRTTGAESVSRPDNAIDTPSRATFGLDVVTG